jgi:hypothetical protein
MTMSTARRWAAAIAVLFATGAPCFAQTIDEEDSPRAVVIYAERENGLELATLLLEVGIDATPVRFADLTEQWTTDADLVVIAACCPVGDAKSAWSETFLDRLGAARVLACGDSGGQLFMQKKLLVSRDHAVHWETNSAAAVFNDQRTAAVYQDLLERPNVVETEPRPRGLRRLAGPELQHVRLQQPDTPERNNLGIYDGGAFPDGSVGIARVDGGGHHWLICQQGNYTLWGASARAAEMTREAKHLWANLAWQLAHAKPAPLVVPPKEYIDDAHAATLKGGWRGKYFHAIEQMGEVTVRLEWEGDEQFMLLCRGPFVRRMDGGSPLEVTFPVNAFLVGNELEIQVAAFALEEGAECPYELTVEWAAAK